MGRVLVVVVLTCGASVAAASVPRPAVRSYLEVVDLFRTGHEQLALDAVAMLVRSDLDAGRDSLLNAFKRFGGGKVETANLRAAAVLHVERAFIVLAATNSGSAPGPQVFSAGPFNAPNSADFHYQIGLAHSYVQKLAASDRKSPFVERWWLFVIARLLVHWDVDDARLMCKGAHATIDDTPELLLACGATEEMAWSLEHEAEGNSRVKGDLKDAEARFRRALSLKPDLIEARLRLGRVLTLRGAPEGIKTLEVIVPGKDDGFSYLARLFEGDALERLGDLAEAERRYVAAIALLPSAQSAYIALAHVRHARGARSEAVADVAALARDRTLPDTSEPWFWYPRGTAWRAIAYGDELRTLIRQ